MTITTTATLQLLCLRMRNLYNFLFHIRAGRVFRRFGLCYLNSLSVLTTRAPQSEESLRYIFAVFLIDDVVEGNARDEGQVSAHEKYRIKLTPKEARKLRFWNYHTNQNNKEKIFWGSGLHRYLTNEQAAQILRDIMRIKLGTEDEQLSAEFFDYFCAINGIEESTLEAPKGALKSGGYL